MKVEWRGFSAILDGHSIAVVLRPEEAKVLVDTLDRFDVQQPLATLLSELLVAESSVMDG